MTVRFDLEVVVLDHMVGQELLAHRLDTLPGITGLWQVSGRSELGFAEQVLMGIMYIENWSLGLDLRILLRTIPAVLSGKGAF